LQGFVHGVTGVVTKPVEGAKQEGVGGFFKGTALDADILLLVLKVRAALLSPNILYESLYICVNTAVILLCCTVAGVGKGLVGVFTRPASGVVDFASSSFEGIRRYYENIEFV